MRRFVIGDIHNNFNALKQLIGLIKPTKEDLFIFLGDYVDGWDDAFEVVEYLITFKNTFNCIFLEGNHDTWCKNWLNTGYKDEWWLRNGGNTTLNSYQKRDMRLFKARHEEFFNTLLPYYILENKVFVHGGFFDQQDINKQSLEDLTWDRDLYQVAIQRPILVKFKETIINKPEIYIGHTTTQVFRGRITPKWNNNLCMVDTGCGWTGKLTALNIDTKEYIQSDLAKKLNPNAAGRS